jgi:hypothetical protein
MTNTTKVANSMLAGSFAVSITKTGSSLTVTNSSGATSTLEIGPYLFGLPATSYTSHGMAYGIIGALPAETIVSTITKGGLVFATVTSRADDSGYWCDLFYPQDAGTYTFTISTTTSGVTIAKPVVVASAPTVASTTVTNTTDPTHVDNSDNAASTGWVRAVAQGYTQEVLAREYLNVTTSRVMGQTYPNDTDHEIEVFLVVHSTEGAYAHIIVDDNDITPGAGVGVINAFIPVTFTVSPGKTYAVGGNATVQSWCELR